MEKMEIKIKGKKLECLFCKNDKFYEFPTITLYPKKGIKGLFFGTKPKVYVCSNCGLKQDFFEMK